MDAGRFEWTWTERFPEVGMYLYPWDIGRSFYEFRREYGALGVNAAAAPIPGSTLGVECRAILIGMGLNPAIRFFPAGCDQFAFTGKETDSVPVGPGDIAQAHAADEFVDIGQLALARDFYRRFIRERLSWNT